jgi:phage-related protein
MIPCLNGSLLEISLHHWRDAFPVLYAVKIVADIGVIHTFEKKLDQDPNISRRSLGLITK